MKEQPAKTIYRLHDDGVTGYKFPPLPDSVMSRYKGVEKLVLPGIEEMDRADDALTSQSRGYGVNMSKEITEEEYLKL